MTERPYHHGNLRTALLAQAELIVRERGVAELSLRELAREVGVSHGAPRRHFPDRQALLDALAEEGFARLGRELRDAVERRRERRSSARLQATASAYVRFATRDAALLQLMFASKHGEPSASAARGRRARVRGDARADRAGPGRGRARDAATPSASGSSCSRRSRASRRSSAAAWSRAEQLDELVADAIAHFLRGSRVPV